jgi:hypothetical protein
MIPLRSSAPAVSVPLAFFRDRLTHPDGRSYGDCLDAWQREDFERAFYDHQHHVWWERPRGHSKTMDAGAVGLFHILATPGARAYLTACDRDQAALCFDSLAGFVRRSEELSSLVRVGRFEVSSPRTDALLTVLAADAPGSWGLRPSLVVADELSAWRGQAAEEFFWSLYSSLGKMPGRMLVATTAGWDRASLAWKLREAIREDPAWIFSRRAQCASWVAADFLEAQRRVLPEHVFQMLHMNE